jgi:isocitrate dehydrogenase
VGTKEFAKAIVANLGKKTTLLKEVSYAKEAVLNLPKYVKKTAAKKI